MSVVGVAAAVSLAVVGIPTLPAQADQPTSGAQAQTASTAAPVAARVNKKRGIKVKDAKVSANGRSVTARVKWDARLRKRDGKNHRFNMRLVAVKKNGKTRELDRFSTKKLKAKHRSLAIELGRKKAKRARNAHDLVLSVSQQYDRPQDSDKLYERNYVTTTHLRPKTNRTARVSVQAATGTRNCSKVAIVPDANLSNCNLVGVYLNNADLNNADLSGANLTGADLTGADLEGADLTGANLTGAILSDANLSDANLTGADLTGAVLSDAVLSDATLVATSCTQTTWPNGNIIVGPTCPTS